MPKADMPHLETICIWAISHRTLTLRQPPWGPQCLQCLKALHSAYSVFAVGVLLIFVGMPRHGVTPRFLRFDAAVAYISGCHHHVSSGWYSLNTSGALVPSRIKFVQHYLAHEMKREARFVRREAIAPIVRFTPQ